MAEMYNYTTVPLETVDPVQLMQLIAESEAPGEIRVAYVYDRKGEDSYSPMLQPNRSYQYGKDLEVHFVFRVEDHLDAHKHIHEVAEAAQHATDEKARLVRLAALDDEQAKLEQRMAQLAEERNALS